MPNSVVAVADGDFRFDPSAVFDVVRAAWPRSTFAGGVSGRLSEVSAGQITVLDGEELVALVEVDVAGGEALDVDWRTPETLAQVVSVITSLPGFAGDSSVVLTDWADTLVELRPPGTTARDLLAARGVTCCSRSIRPWSRPERLRMHPPVRARRHVDARVAQRRRVVPLPARRLARPRSHGRAHRRTASVGHALLRGDARRRGRLASPPTAAHAGTRSRCLKPPPPTELRRHQPLR